VGDTGYHSMSLSRTTLGQDGRVQRQVRRQVSRAETVAVALGGMLGASARYGMAQAIHVKPEGFPWATFWTNVLGSLLLGLIVGVMARPFAHALASGFLTTGFCGGFTTFSTFSVETDLLVKNGHAPTAALYVVSSVVAGLVAVAIALNLARTR
jgi:CrcB protein